jgi:hypothetical protein
VTGILYAFLLEAIAARRHLKKLRLIQAREWARTLAEGLGPGVPGGGR